MGGRSALLLALGLSALAASAAAAPLTQTLAAQGSWAAIKFGARCEAVARPLLPAARRRPAARAGFTFNAGHSLHGQFHALLSRLPRPGSSVMLTVGERPFLLIVRGDWAWSRGPLQEAAIIDAARAATSMRIDARDGAGGRFVDRYLLNGAPTAIDAAAAGCAGKI